MYKWKKRFLRKLFKILRLNPLSMPSVQYWKYADSAEAKVIKVDGALMMKIEGEKELFPGFPRFHSLFGSLSPLKHQIKNQIFNASWQKLDQGIAHEEIITDIKDTLTHGLTEFWEKVKYDAVPPEKMVKPVRELWRAFSVLEASEPRIKPFKEMLCFILQEDDAYRFRAQWLASITRPRWFIDPVKWFTLVLSELEQAEMVSDMKERQRLLKRILLLALEDDKIRNLFNRFVKEVDWKKVKLSRADKFHFRGKYFKCDWLYFDF